MPEQHRRRSRRDGYRVEPEDQRAYELARMRHSSAHLMAEAVQEIFPDAKFAIGPAIENGFYYDIDLPRSLTPDDLARSKADARAPGRDGSRSSARSSRREEALEIFGDNPYKVELIEGFPDGERSRRTSRATSSISAGVRTSTTRATSAPFKLHSVAGAYWRGDEKRPMLQRIYGTAWPTQEELDDHLHRLEEAQRRDHRRLGRELDSSRSPRRSARA